MIQTKMHFNLNNNNHNYWLKFSMGSILSNIEDTIKNSDLYMIKTGMFNIIVDDTCEAVTKDYMFDLFVGSKQYKWKLTRVLDNMRYCTINDLYYHFKLRWMDILMLCESDDVLSTSDMQCLLNYSNDNPEPCIEFRSNIETCIKYLQGANVPCKINDVDGFFTDLTVNAQNCMLNALLRCQVIFSPSFFDEAKNYCTHIIDNKFNSRTNIY